MVMPLPGSYSQELNEPDVPGSRDKNRFWNPDSNTAPYNAPGVADDRVQLVADAGTPKYTIRDLKPDEMVPKYHVVDVPQPGTSPEATQAQGIPGLSYMWDMLKKGATNVEKTVTAPEFGKGVQHGIADPLIGAAQGASHIGLAPVGVGSEFGQMQPEPPATTKDIDTAVRGQEQQFQQNTAANPLAASWGRLVGNVVSPPNVAAGVGAGAVGAGVGRGILGGALAGAGAGAMEPVTEGDYWATKGKQVGTSAAGGALLGAGAGAIAPRMAPDAAKLVRGGMEPGAMTAGQLAGPAARRLEESGLKNFPILSSFVRGAEGRSIDSFDRATINQALDPIGASLPKNTTAGHQANELMQRAGSKAFDDVLGRIPAVTIDPELKTAFDALRTEARGDPDVWRKFKPRIDGLEKTFANAGRLTGRDVQSEGSDFLRQARGYKNSDDQDKRELGRLLQDTHGALMDAIQRQYPAERTNLQNAKNTWAMITRIQDAAVKGKEGRFMPSNLLAAVKQQSKGVRRSEFANGDALFQDWAETAQRVLPSKVAESGTVERQLMTGGLIEGLGSLAGHAPGTALGIAGAGIGGSLPYTRLGQKAVGGLFSEPGAARKAMQYSIRGATPGLTDAAARRRKKQTDQP